MKAVVRVVALNDADRTIDVSDAISLIIEIEGGAFEIDASQGKLCVSAVFGSLVIAPLTGAAMKTAGALEITMPDGSRWTVPVEVIARHRAKYYVHEFNGDVERSLNEDTWPLFETDDYEIEDWAANNMNWEDDVQPFAWRVTDPPPVDYQEGWVNGDKRVIWEKTP